MGQLSDLQIKAAEPRDKEYMLADGEGLYLRVRPNGKVWIYRYKQSGKEAKLSLGPYPAVPLAAARKKARTEAEKRAGGIDPKEARREEEERERVARLNTFELMARAWHAQAKKDREWSASYAEKVMRHLELHIFPWIGALRIGSIAPTEVVRCLHRIKERGNPSHLWTAPWGWIVGSVYFDIRSLVGVVARRLLDQARSPVSVAALAPISRN